MNTRWLAVFALAAPLLAENPANDSPVKEPTIIESASPGIELPPSPPDESTMTTRTTVASAEPISVTQKDPQDPAWRLYDNRIVKARLRVKPSWTVMEFKETENSGTVSYTLSRLPLVTFAIVRAPLEGPLDIYVSKEALAPLYTKVIKRRPAMVGGRKGISIQGILQDGRKDESFFATEGTSFYRVSFSAPEDAWADSEKQFEQLERDLHWKN